MDPSLVLALFFSVVVAVAMCTLQFVGLATIREEDATQCLLGVHKAISYDPLETPRGRTYFCKRVITMWGHRATSNGITYWMDGAEPKTEITSLVVLGTSVLLIVSLVVCLVTGRTSEKPAAPLPTFDPSALKADEEPLVDDGKKPTDIQVLAADVPETIIATTASPTALSVSASAILTFLATVMLFVGAWCVATFHEKWNSPARERFLVGYYILVCVAMPAVVVVFALLVLGLVNAICHQRSSADLV